MGAYTQVCIKFSKFWFMGLRHKKIIFFFVFLQASRSNFNGIKGSEQVLLHQLSPQQAAFSQGATKIDTCDEKKIELEL